MTTSDLTVRELIIELADLEDAIRTVGTGRGPRRAAPVVTELPRLIRQQHQVVRELRRRRAGGRGTGRWPLVSPS
ncbi:MAG TPA: hypothetical protein VFL99_02100 [Segeticoccus sp.]|uniref:hypothetical protein n=1 Tax=Segeticoccus sp. TaxID=2706531 RepID=UPI002D7E49E3|nr:hypothetical protein [Segeticoccus sp.]HET8599089.1 hypothetical protein [Segeticoccus sp.]